jgi:mono/diheme cytochrome c family protein
MQKNLKTCIVLIFAVLSVLLLAGHINAGFRSATTMDDLQARTAREIFIANCARCHGADGLGETEQGRKLDVPDLREKAKHDSTAKIVRVVTNGRDDMPAFGKKLSRKEISSLAAYLRKL